MDIQQWTGFHPTKWITDSANNHRYQAHQYFWVDGWQDGGNYSRSYSYERNRAQELGWYA